MSTRSVNSSCNTWGNKKILGHRAPSSRCNVAVVSHAWVVRIDLLSFLITTAPASCIKAAVSKVAWWPWPFDLESGVRVTCDVGYLCANFGLPRPVLDLGPMYATNRRQTKALLNTLTAAAILGQMQLPLCTIYLRRGRQLQSDAGAAPYAAVWATSIHVRRVCTNRKRDVLTRPSLNVLMPPPIRGNVRSQWQTPTQQTDRLTRPPYCSFGTGRMRPWTSTMWLATVMPNACRYGSSLNLALETWRTHAQALIHNTDLIRCWLPHSLTGSCHQMCVRLLNRLRFLWRVTYFCLYYIISILCVFLYFVFNFLHCSTG